MPGFHPSLSVSWSLLKFMSTESAMLSNHLIPCHPLLLLPAIFLSIRVFSSESGGQSIGASASVFPVNIQGWFPLGLTGLISLQSKELSGVFSNTTAKASILRCSAFFMVQLSHPYMATGKIIAMTNLDSVKKQRYHFADKGLSGQIYGFSSSHVWM